MLWFIITILIIVFIVALSIIFKFFKKVFQFVWGLLGVILFILAIMAVVLFIDARGFSQKFDTSEKLMLLSDSDEIITGFQGKFQGEDINMLTESDLSELNEKYEKKHFDLMLGDNYKMFVVHKNAFNNSDFQEDDITKKQAFNIIDSKNSLNDYATILSISNNVEKEKVIEYLKVNETNYSVKARIFALLFSEAMNENESFLVEQIKEGNVLVHPKTPIFLFIEYIPNTIIKRVIQTRGSANE